jgi:hypothetical protein
MSSRRDASSALCCVLSAACSVLCCLLSAVCWLCSVCCELCAVCCVLCTVCCVLCAVCCRTGDTAEMTGARNVIPNKSESSSINWDSPSITNLTHCRLHAPVF